MKKIGFLLLMMSANVFATPVNVNTADAMTISKALKGISLKKADAIVADRVKNGLFKTADDVARVAGIGAKLVASNKADILVEDSAATPKLSESTTKVADPKATPDTTKKIDLKSKTTDTKSTGAAPAPISVPEAKSDAKTPAIPPKK